MERLLKFVAVSDLYSSSMSCGAEPHSSVIFCTMASHFLSGLPTGCTMEQAEIAPAFTNGVEGWSFSSKMAMIELNGSPVASAPIISSTFCAPYWRRISMAVCTFDTDSMPKR